MLETPSGYNFDRSKLAISYDVKRLQLEVLSAVQDSPPYIHYSVIPLTAAVKRNVEVTDFSQPHWTSWVETAFLSSCPYIQQVLGSLQCQKTNVRLLRLEPGGELKQHTDPQLNLQLHKQVRLHVPIFTNERVEFMLNGTPVPLQLGELWYLRLSDPHSVLNKGNAERIQLSIDVVVNEWVVNMIAGGDKR